MVRRLGRERPAAEANRVHLQQAESVITPGASRGLDYRTQVRLIVCVWCTSYSYVRTAQRTAYVPHGAPS